MIILLDVAPEVELPVKDKPEGRSRSERLCVKIPRYASQWGVEHHALFHRRGYTANCFLGPNWDLTIDRLGGAAISIGE